MMDNLPHSFAVAVIRCIENGSSLGNERTIFASRLYTFELFRIVMLWYFISLATDEECSLIYSYCPRGY